MELPAGITPDALASLRQDIGGAGAYAPTVVDKTARTLTATLVTFGGANLKPLGAAAADRRHALRAGPQDVSLPDPPGSLSARQRLEITLQVTAAQASIADLQSRGLFIATIYSQQQIAGLPQRSGEDGYIALAQPFLNDAAIERMVGWLRRPRRQRDSGNRPFHPRAVGIFGASPGTPFAATSSLATI